MLWLQRERLMGSGAQDVVPEEEHTEPSSLPRAAGPSRPQALLFLLHPPVSYSYGGRHFLIFSSSLLFSLL